MTNTPAATEYCDYVGMNFIYLPCGGKSNVVVTSVLCRCSSHKSILLALSCSTTCPYSSKVSSCAFLASHLAFRDRQLEGFLAGFQGELAHVIRHVFRKNMLVFIRHDDSYLQNPAAAPLLIDRLVAVFDAKMLPSLMMSLVRTAWS